MTENIKVDDVRAKIDSYFDVIDSFCELLEEENQALRDYKIDIITKLYDKKTKTVLTYRGLVAYFLKNQEAIKELDADEVQELKEASQDLDELLKENDKLLKSRMETSETIMNSIVNIAKVTTKANSTYYGAQGDYCPMNSSRSAMAVNQTL